MKLEQSFEVDAPLERVWAALIDVERVAPCLPGAAVTGRNDDGSYAGSFSVRIGPTSAAYSGTLQMQDLDEDAHRATMHAQGSDKRGQGGAEATIVSTLEDLGEGRTRVDVSTDYRITGRLARFGRGGMIEDISNKLLRQFADSLQSQLAGGGEPTGTGAGADAASTTSAPSAPSAEDAPPPSAPSAEDAPPPRAPSTQDAPQQQPPPQPPPTAAPPLDAGSLIGSVLLERVKRNPLPVAAAAVALAVLIALRRR